MRKLIFVCLSALLVMFVASCADTHTKNVLGDGDSLLLDRTAEHDR